MAKTTTVLFPIDIPYKAEDDTVLFRKYVLTLSLSMEAVETEVGAEGSCGEITINGAVMPVDDHPLAMDGEGGETNEGGEAMQEAA